MVGILWATQQVASEGGRGTPRTAPPCPPGPATTPLSGLWAADFTVTNLSVSFTLVLLLCGAVTLRLYLRHPRKLPAVLVSLREAAVGPAAPWTWGARCPVSAHPPLSLTLSGGTLRWRED